MPNKIVYKTKNVYILPGQAGYPLLVPHKIMASILYSKPYQKIFKIFTFSPGKCQKHQKTGVVWHFSDQNGQIFKQFMVRKVLNF